VSGKASGVRRSSIWTIAAIGAFRDKNESMRGKDEAVTSIDRVFRGTAIMILAAMFAGTRQGQTER
jgi:hypothetical protein